jgi:hypothetical protein
MRPYPLLLLNCLYIFWFLAIILKVHPPFTAYNTRVRSYLLVLTRFVYFPGI